MGPTDFVNNNFATAFSIAISPFSPDSRYVVYNYSPFNPTPAQVGAVIYNNNNGVLTPAVTVPNTVTINGQQFGSVSLVNDFNFNQMGVVVESVQNGNVQPFNPVTTLAIQVYPFNQTTGTLGTPVTSPFKPAALSGLYNSSGAFGTGFYTGNFTIDGKFFLVSYLAPNLNFYVQVLSLPNLTPLIPGPGLLILTPTTIGGQEFAPIANGPFTFQLCTNGVPTNYVTFTTAFGINNPITGSVVDIQGPFHLFIYRLDNNGSTLTLVVDQPLSQFANSAQAFNPLNCCLTTTKLLVTTRPTYTSLNQTAAFTDLSGVQISQPPNTGLGNVLVFSFDGTNLDLLAKKNFNTTVLGTNWYADGKTFGLVTATDGQFGMPPQVGDMLFYQLTKVKTKCDTTYCLCNVNDVVAVPQGVNSFSLDGKYLGGVGPIVLNINGTEAVNTTLLFKVNTSFKLFQCPSNNSSNQDKNKNKKKHHTKCHC